MKTKVILNSIILPYPFARGLAAAAILAATMPWGQPASAAEPGIIAEAGGEAIGADDILPYLANLGQEQRAALKGNRALLNQAVRSLLTRQLILKDALAAGWGEKPEVAVQLEKLKDAVVTELYLQEVAKAPEGYPTDSEVRMTYDAKKSELVIPRQLRLAQIYVASSEDADKTVAAAAEQKIKAIAADLAKADADFSELARSHSQEPRSAAQGGEVGWLVESNVQPEIRKGASELKVGSTTAPIRLQDGWYIVKLLDNKEARTPAYDEVKDQIAQALKAQREKLNREAYLAQIQQQHQMAVNELALGKLLEGDAKP